MKIVTVEEMRRLDAACATQMGIPTAMLMENAGRAVAEKARDALGGDVAGVPVLVLVGPGNNGGDGLVAARYLQEWGAEATAYLVAARKPDDPNLNLCYVNNVIVLEASSDPGLERLRSELSRSQLVIDAVLGTGHLRPLEGAVRDAMSLTWRERQRRHDLTLLALDIPTGMDADTGAVDEATPFFDLTVTLAYPKHGLFRFPGAAHIGRLEIADIGIPPQLAEDIKTELVTAQWASERLPVRPLDSHKGTFGRLLIVGGSRNYVGATALAAEAAYRVGAGLVTVAAPESIYPVLAASVKEATHLPLPEAETGHIGVEAVLVVREALTQYDALVVGCGIGQHPMTKAFLDRLLLDVPNATLPLLVDADGLTHLAHIPGWPERLAWPTVLTPHPGEMARLTGSSTRDVQADRLATARLWASRWGHAIVLKGAYTVIVSPDGRAMVSPFANPALASAGTGDVLAGAIGGLLAQGMKPFEAAACGVYLHAAAGDMVREETGDAGLLARDLLPRLPEVIHNIRI